MGPDLKPGQAIGSNGAVLDSRFRVNGIKNLRVVDASIFPKIPGLFIVCPIYVASQKASEIIIADAKNRKEVMGP
jgi:choline dehydrogenase